MVDSVVIRIHEASTVHAQLLKLLHKKGIEGKSVTNKHIPLEIANDQDNFLKRSTVTRFFTDHVDGYNVEAAYMNHLPSWHYDIAYRINFLQNFIEINLSIPKYLYGTNVFQFIPHYFDKDYHFYFSAENFFEVRDHVYNRLKRFLRYFFIQHFGENLVNEYYVQIMQVDLCYNKFFNTEEDAHEYLADLKRIRKKHIRETTKGKGHYHTGLHFSTSDYAFKIYHKGAEFKEHDRKKIIQRKLWPPVLVNEVQAVADRIIRFELSLRNGLLNSLFKDYIFRKDDEQFQRSKTYYRQMRQNEFIINSKGDKLERHELSRKQKGMIKYAKDILNKTFRFYLACDTAFHVQDDDQNDVIDGRKKLQFDHEMRFSKDLFRHSFDRFKKFFDEYEVAFTGDMVDTIAVVSKDSKDDSEKMARLLDYAVTKGGMPRDVKGVLSWASVRLCVSYLRDHTWEELRKSGFISERKYYRLRALFKACGWLNPATVMVPTGKNDFRDYYEAVERLQTGFNVDKFLRPVTF